MAHDAEGLHTGTMVPGAPAHEQSFPPFDPNNFAAELIWLAITFGAIYFLMSRIALPRVTKILAARKDKIDSDLAAAAKAQEDAVAAAAAHEKTLAEAKDKAQAMGQAAHAEVQAKNDARRATLESELNAKLAAAEEQIAATKTAAMANVDSIATDAAQAILQHLTGKPADPAAVAAAIAASKNG
ncbi:F0F1 ATP synthase subunit B' [Rhodoblastus acidophilus]|uniref:ATP synthase subunit b n=1 Tax=Candidatus Rhodoblastus alkanivorans TaxID=2954117 RepID=A0ABS9Z418_9HYPH|nr:F0F1 ATP synthase subunit B' [Candidatus Rhodoblastus alkanivorans]MCI4679257.1 F0F1 ATP synthase subunit B' [Candidatus Rhodoblastus alkanivorans]MCI4682419.1 F0F1 ATP synthase subunit B' [Candidatus Rhodoblastus alkanivorans]MDI4639725.1 F0F1 ATP synthase subunit B' [Rhodoblastus acidophilus]